MTEHLKPHVKTTKNGVSLFFYGSGDNQKKLEVAVRLLADPLGILVMKTANAIEYVGEQALVVGEQSHQEQSNE